MREMHPTQEQLNSWRKRQQPRVLLSEIPCLKCGTTVPIKDTCVKCGAGLAKRKIPTLILVAISGFALFAFLGFSAIYGGGIIMLFTRSNNPTLNTFTAMAIVALIVGLLKLGWSAMTGAFTSLKSSQRVRYLRLAQRSIRYRLNQSRIGWQNSSRLLAMGLASDYVPIPSAWGPSAYFLWKMVSEHRREITSDTLDALKDLLFVDLLTDIARNLREGYAQEAWNVLLSLTIELSDDMPALMEAAHIIARDWARDDPYLGLHPDAKRELLFRCTHGLRQALEGENRSGASAPT